MPRCAGAEASETHEGVAAESLPGPQGPGLKAGSPRGGPPASSTEAYSAAAEDRCASPAGIRFFEQETPGLRPAVEGVPLLPPLSLAPTRGRPAADEADSLEERVVARPEPASFPVKVGRRHAAVAAVAAAATGPPSRGSDGDLGLLQGRWVFDTGTETFQELVQGPFLFWHNGTISEIKAVAGGVRCFQAQAGGQLASFYVVGSSLVWDNGMLWRREPTELPEDSESSAESDDGGPPRRPPAAQDPPSKLTDAVRSRPPQAAAASGGSSTTSLASASAAAAAVAAVAAAVCPAAVPAAAASDVQVAPEPEVYSDLPLLEDLEEEDEWLQRKLVTGAIGKLAVYHAGQRPGDDVLELRRGRQQRVVVTRLRPKGIAYESNVRRGDQLVAINGEAVSAAGPTLRKFFRLRGPAILVFLGFVGKIDAEVRVRHKFPGVGVPDCSDLVVPRPLTAGLPVPRLVGACAFRGRGNTLLLATGRPDSRPPSASPRLRRQDTPHPGDRDDPRAAEVGVCWVADDEEQQCPSEGFASDSQEGVYELHQVDALRVTRRVLRTIAARSSLEGRLAESEPSIDL